MVCATANAPSEALAQGLSHGSRFGANERADRNHAVTRLATQLLATSRGHVPFDLTAELNGKLSSPELREFIRKHADEVDAHGLHFANGVLDGPLNWTAPLIPDGSVTQLRGLEMIRILRAG